MRQDFPSLARRAAASEKETRPPEGTVVYAIGDIHGRADLLGELQAKIRTDAGAREGPRKVIVYLGDYVDRGLQSREVIDRLLDETLPGFLSVPLKGNHEEALLKFLDDIDIAPGWFSYGGDTTLYSYGVEVPRPPLTAEKLLGTQAEFLRKLPNRHLAFLRGLRLYHEEGDYYFAHAGARPGRALGDQAEEDLLWIRDEFLFSAYDFGKIIVHGHTIAPDPEFQPNRIGIDTGAFASGRLTCLVLDGAERQILQTG